MKIQELHTGQIDQYEYKFLDAAAQIIHTARIQGYHGGQARTIPFKKWCMWYNPNQFTFRGIGPTVRLSSFIKLKNKYLLHIKVSSEDTYYPHNSIFWMLVNAFDIQISEEFEKLISIILLKNVSLI